jgi:hypothetical protein
VTADIDWSNLQVASAFVLGAALGTIATIRVMRAVLHVVRPDRHRDE